MAEINDIYEARIICTQANQISINVRHYRVSSKAGTGATDGQIANIVSLSFHQVYKDVMASSASFRGVGVKRIRPLPASGETTTILDLGPGSQAGDPLPLQTSGMITLKTGLAGRSFRGRVYVPFPAEVDNGATGVPTAGYLTRLDTLAARFLLTLTAGSAGNTNDLAPVVFSRKLNDVVVLTQTIGRPRWATQRPRGSYGAANIPPF